MSETPVEPGRIYPTLRYRDAPAMIAWLCRAFGFAEHVVYPAPDGTIAALNRGSLSLTSLTPARFAPVSLTPVITPRCTPRGVNPVSCGTAGAASPSA